MDFSSLLFGPRTMRRTARIECQVVRLRDFTLVADRVENISHGGLLVGPADPVLTGEEVVVSFQLPGFSDWFDAEAVVARVIHGRRPGECRRSLGLALTHVDSASRRLLDAYVRRLPPAPPTFRPKSERILSFTSLNLGDFLSTAPT
ncbi:MAG: PilZ domain-containing protein [Myxococcales bacterium]|nr:PilZ domain-containing protein [Myxococcales bacterium]MCB9575864.1 PilZ domain-containing protein [Polyangiaceae bacterium]